MLNAANILKAAVISAILNMVHVYFVSSAVFVRQFSAEGQELGRIEAFIKASQLTIDFWSHIIKGWAAGFWISLFSCLLLLLWLQIRSKKATV